MEQSTFQKKRLEKLLSEFFLTEPLLFSAGKSHSLVENTSLSVPLRTGKMRIEFSPLLLEPLSDALLREFLKIELLRILLLHPYKRLPHRAQKNILHLASDLAIYQIYKPILQQHAGSLQTEAQLQKQEPASPQPDNQQTENPELLSGVTFLKEMASRFHNLTFPLGEKWSGTEEEKFFLRNLNVDSKTGRLLLVDSLNYEQWYKKLLFLIENTGIKGENAGTKSRALGKLLSAQDDMSAELWEENEEAQKTIQNEIKRAEIDNGWGSLGGNSERTILGEADVSLNYRRILSQFRAQILNSKRNLTRMRPSRRFGFSQMGSRYERKANILIAVDSSGSISDEDFNKFFKAIGNFFFCGIEKLDLIFFDVSLKSTKPVTLKKNFKLSEIKGKGGTNFQAPFDFFMEHTEYDGLILFTDGEGAIPSVGEKRKAVLWILTSRLFWEKARPWIEKQLKHRCTYIP